MIYDNYEYRRALGAQKAAEDRLMKQGIAPGTVEFNNRIAPYRAFCDRCFKAVKERHDEQLQ